MFVICGSARSRGPRFEEYEASARVDRRSETSFFLDSISPHLFDAVSAAPASSDAVADRSVIIAKVFSSFLDPKMILKPSLLI